LAQDRANRSKKAKANFRPTLKVRIKSGLPLSQVSAFEKMSRAVCGGLGSRHDNGELATSISHETNQLRADQTGAQASGRTFLRKRR
jgi:hypothetical protein